MFCRIAFPKVGYLDMWEILKLKENARREMIDMCLVKSASTSVVF